MSRIFKFATNSLHLQRNLIRLGGSRLHSSQHEPPKQQQQQPASPLPMSGGHNEVAHHAKMASTWWQTDGPMKALHSLNEIRVPFIRDGLVARGSVQPDLVNTTCVLRNVKILEVGCGAGVLTEALARLGADVTAIDLGEEVISTAKQHLEQCSAELKERINYHVIPVAQHAEDNKDKYDAVVVSEVIEHIGEKVNFLADCVNALRPGGSIFITTPNKTVPLWIGGILLGEYVLNLAPKGTHHWDMLISPIDLQRILDTLHCQTVLVNGSTYDFWRNTWRWVDSTTMCYALQAVKAESS